MTTIQGTKELVRFACELADSARGILRRRFRSSLSIDTKADSTPVTEADREVEAVLRKKIGAAYPSHGILGEEEGADRLDAEFVWVLDPIDGTKAFASGKPLFGTLISLVHAGHPFIGVIDSPITEERWLGVDGEGATLNGEPIHVRPRRSVAESVLYAGSPHAFESESTGGFTELRKAVSWVQYSTDCYAYGLLARGDVDLVLEIGLDTYDCCALVPVVSEAGGHIARWDGSAVGLDDDTSLIAASDPALAREALAILRPS